MTTEIRVTVVADARDRRRFIMLPHRIYADDPFWVAPLHQEVRKLLNPRKNPFFKHSEAAFWLAWRGSELVGRISAQINQLHLGRYHDATGNFGFLEAVDDQAVFDALLRTAEDWLKTRNIRRSIGPYSLTVNDDIGVLMSGYDMVPYALMGHSPRYYAERLDAAGYKKAKDVHAYRLFGISPKTKKRLDRISAHFGAQQGITLRRIDLRRFEIEMRELLEIYNDAWRDNWGFLPVAEDEAEVLIEAIKQIIRADYIILAEMNGRKVGFIAAIPNINEILADLNGRLLPFGWAKFLWRMKMAPPKSARILLFGTLYEMRDSPLSGGIAAMLLNELINNFLAAGTLLVECSWILEDNAGSLAITRVFAELAKTYRIFQKDLV